MIKIKDYANVLKSVYSDEVLEASSNVFKNALMSQSPTNTFVVDFLEMGLPRNILEDYYNKGLSVLAPVVTSKKKLNISMVTEAYIIYTGLLNNEFVVGYDTTKGMVTSIFTKSKALLEKLASMGAFENMEKYKKNMKALFGEGGPADYGNKVLTSFEKESLALGRLDILSVVDDSVSIDLVVPTKFRTDYGSNTFKLYPYSIFPYLSFSLIDFVNNLKDKTFSENSKKYVDVRGITVMQAEEDGNVKNRKVTFKSDELVKAYKRGNYRDGNEVEDAQELLKRQVQKTTLGWDCLKLYLKGYNMEASLYSTPYTTIRFERLLNIMRCSLKDIDTSMYMVDFDCVRRLFRARVNNWKLQDFNEFNKIVNTESCANILERCKMIDAWANNMDDADLLKIMKMKHNLFEVSNEDGTVKTISSGLDEMYRNKPNAVKHMESVSLESDYLNRKTQIQNLLNKGVCKIESNSVRTGAPRVYFATNSQAVLNASYGENRLNEFESSKRALDGVKKLIEQGKVTSYNNFLQRLHVALVDGLVDYGSLDDTSTPADWIKVVEDARAELDENKGSSDPHTVSNPYLINFRRINADTRNEFYGAVDVRNITCLEYGEQKIRK